jgi:ABC-2 type transport system ATP-binding protein
MTNATIVCDGLVVGYRGVPVLAATNLTLEPGVTAIIGRNGAGKSTLLRTFATLLPPIAGTVSICGHRGDTRRELHAVRRCLGFVSQRPDFPPSFTVEEMLRYTASIQRVDGDAAVGLACSRFELELIRHTRIGAISGGERQRSFLAQATLHDPPVLLLDEPTVGLDIPSRHEFKQLLRSIGEHGTVVFTTHVADDLSGIADHVVVIDRRHGARHLGSAAELLAAGLAGGVDLETVIASQLH